MRNVSDPSSKPSSTPSRTQHRFPHNLEVAARPSTIYSCSSGDYALANALYHLSRFCVRRAAWLRLPMQHAMGACEQEVEPEFGEQLTHAEDMA